MGNLQMKKQFSKAPSFTTLSVYTPRFYTLNLTTRFCQVFCWALIMCNYFQRTLSLSHSVSHTHTHTHTSHWDCLCPYWREQTLLYIKCIQHSINKVLLFKQMDGPLDERNKSCWNVVWVFFCLWPYDVYLRKQVCVTLLNPVVWNRKTQVEYLKNVRRSDSNPPEVTYLFNCKD